MTALDPIPTNWNRLSNECLGNSRRWFPHLHDDDFTAAVHFTLGLAGEVGEVVEAIEEGAASEDFLLEVADVVTYALDLAATLGIDIDGTPSGDYLPTGEAESLTIAAGTIANAVKKANRAETPMIALRDARPVIAGAVRWILDTALLMADDEDANLVEVIAVKVAICEERWG